MSLAAGTHLGPYEIESAIGAGGMGKVYEPRHPRLTSLVTQVLCPRIASDLHDRFPANGVSHRSAP